MSEVNHIITVNPDNIVEKPLLDILDEQIGSCEHDVELQRRNFAKLLAKVTIIAGEVVNEIDQ